MNIYAHSFQEKALEVSKIMKELFVTIHRSLVTFKALAQIRKNIFYTLIVGMTLMVSTKLVKMFVTRYCLIVGMTLMVSTKLDKMFVTQY